MTRPESVKDFPFLLYIKKLQVHPQIFFAYPVNLTDLLAVTNTVPCFLANNQTFARHGKSLERRKEAEEFILKEGLY